MSNARLAALTIGLLTSACATHEAPGTHAAPVEAKRADAGVQPSSNPLPRFKHCVLHSATVDVHTRVRKGPGGAVIAEPETVSAACAFDAECVERQGYAGPDDGNVKLSCEATRCTCALEPLSGAAPVELSFELATPCTNSQQAKDLLKTRCMAGMTFAEPSHE